VSPILTRPVREQLEHDRVIRQLQAKYKRKTDVIINPANEQNQSVTVGELVVFPDLLIFAEGTKRLLITVEVETGESVNPIEARAEWGVYSKLKVPLHLYVPPQSVDAARRICAEYQILVSELWSYTTTFDQVRFTMVDKSPDAPTVKIPARPEPKVKAPIARAKPAAALRHAQGGGDRSTSSRPQSRGERSGGTRKPAKAKAASKAKPKAKPAAALRHAQGRKAKSGGPERSRGAKPKAKIKKR
jgi:hypothetical protein